MEDYNDKLDEIIADRLKERKYKLNRINEIEESQRTAILRPLIGIASAACILGFVFLWPRSNGSLIENEAIRGANPNVDSLVNNGDYDAALRTIDIDIAKSDSTIKVLRAETKMKMDEELEYLIRAEQLNKENLMKKKQKIEMLKK